MIYAICGYDPLKNLNSRCYWYGIYNNLHVAKYYFAKMIKEKDMFSTGGVPGTYRSPSGFVCWLKQVPFGEQKVDPVSAEDCIVLSPEFL